MSRRSVCVLVLLLLNSLTALSSLHADGERDNDARNVRRIPKEGIAVSADQEAALRATLTELQSSLTTLRESKDPQVQALLPDVQIFERAVRVALDHNEFFSPQDIDKASGLLQEGLKRARQLLANKPEWPAESGLVVRGYVSRIDHTVQPYGLVVPETYAFNHSVPTRCDLWFHGRGETLSEVNFIWDRLKNRGQYAPDHTIVLHPYGRYSNAFKFAGEVDVLEALQDVQQRYRIDEDRISVRGFSMGGAACWQFAVHYPDRWFAANPGAGFSETPEFLKFFQKETLTPKPWEQTLWNWYDCNRYALNLTHCPTIAYSGEDDVQKQAADIMEAALKDHGVQLRHVIGAKMGHRIDDASKQMIEAGMSSLAKAGRSMFPQEVHFQTYTLKYNRMHWATIDGLIEHWKPARIDVTRKALHTDTAQPVIQLNIGTTNVSALTLDFPPGTFSADLATGADKHLTLQVHGMAAEDFSADPDKAPALMHCAISGPWSDGSAKVQTHRNDQGQWVPGPASATLRKRHNLQGPVDDALMDSFVFVRPTGTAANAAAGKWAASELERAIEHWRRHFRGDARVINDTDVTAETIASSNLVLWGDPSSNRVLASLAQRLPIKWTSQEITVGEDTYSAANHAPILIYPNPMNADRYIVLNSSFTFRDYAYLNNARQVPMLPDWAIINLDTEPGNVWPGEVVAADFFDEAWQLKNK